MDDAKKAVRSALMTKAATLSAGASAPAAVGSLAAGYGALGTVASATGVSTPLVVMASGFLPLVAPVAILGGSAYMGAKAVGWLFDEFTS